ncbi:aminopeptidase N-like [Ctenocephalides felis]|uniref:aminopeptidase N-like n=1 Tax=Ctenocephalides felis TaxID=7515 RepID=UPI000E6E3FDA|nr:aminopeptidase N-like [Ctenocephalides felis]
MASEKSLSKKIQELLAFLWILSYVNSQGILNHRLPGDTEPSHYEVFTSVYLEPDFRFEGKVKIHLICKKETDKIQLHSSELNITSIKLDGNETDIESKEFVEEADFLIIKLKKKLRDQVQYILEIDYEGKIRDDLTGLYRSSYFLPNSTEKRWLAVTQFQPTSARLVFPCYDEPHLKAFFTLTLEHANGLISRSNMPIDKQLIQGDRVITKFERSVRMSTYLFAFLVSDYEAIKNQDNTLSVWTNKGSLKNAEFALEFGEKALKALEKSFGKYKLPKMDLVDIPDFKMGAMENWGMCTFRTPYIIYDNKTSTKSNKLNVAVLIAHEISHNWFGNEVTPSWWEYLWLSEGMATILEAEITDEIYPEWKMMDQFVVKKMQYAMFHDSKYKTRAMSAPITSKDKILFDYIVYQKSGSVLWMLENVLTRDVMRKGLDIFLKEWNGDVVDPSKFYASLSLGGAGNVLPAGVDLAKFLNSWTTRPGFPLITVSRNYTTGMTEFSQQRYLSDGHEDLGTRYWVPITIANEKTSLNDEMDIEWLTDSGTSIVVYTNIGPEDWIFVNKQLKGYYRVNYDAKNWLLLSNTLNSLDYQKIHLLNRAQIMDDALNLAFSGVIEYEIALQLVSYLKQEHHYLPWTAAYHELEYLYTLLGDSSSFQAFIETLTAPVLNSLTLEQSDKDSFMQVFLRNDLLFWVRKLNLPMISESQKIAKEWKDGKRDIEPDIIGGILCGALRDDDEDLWQFVMNKLNETTSNQERNNYITGLACTSSKDKIEELLSMTIDENSILWKKERDTVFHKLYWSGRDATESSLEFLVSNKKEMERLYNDINDCIEGLADYLISEDDLNKEKINKYEITGFTFAKSYTR